MPKCKKLITSSLFITAVILLTTHIPTDFNSTAHAEDLHIDGTMPYGLDLPHIYILLRRQPGGEPLQDSQFGFIPIDAYLDTGASGLLIARASADILGVHEEPNAVYMDVGVGGWQEFQVSELLYIAEADHSVSDPMDLEVYGDDLGPWRLQMTLVDNDNVGPLDIWGVPLMAGDVVVLDPTGLDDIFSLEYFHAKIVEPNSPEIPPVDFHVKIRFTNFVYASHPGNAGPLPTLAYNPLIDSICITQGRNQSCGSWLLDTGAMVSMISTQQAYALGLTDPNGVPVQNPDFTATIGGVGGTTQEVPGYQIDSLSMPMIQGFELVYDNPYVVVHDVGTLDEETGQPILLDGILGTNLLAASSTISWDIVQGPYNRIVIDTTEGFIGFDLKAPWDSGNVEYCGDPNHPWRATDIDRDCYVGQNDLLHLTDDWLSKNCNPMTWNCTRSDINTDGKVDLLDFTALTQQWMTSNTP